MTIQPDSVRDRKKSVETNSIADFKLFETIGLFTILRPAAHRSRSIVRLLCWLVIGLQAVRVGRLIRSFDDASFVMYEVMVAFDELMCAFKGIVITGHANDILAILDVAGYGFTSWGFWCEFELHRCRSKLSAWLRTYATLVYMTFGLWLLTPWIMKTTNSTVEMIVEYGIMYTIYPVYVTCLIAFDCFLVTTCFALEVQFRMASESCAMIGHHLRSRSRVVTLNSPGDRASDCTNTSHKRFDDDYDELIQHIVDIQKIMKKLDDFYAIVRPMVQIQIACACFGIITLVFFTLHMYLMGWSIMSAIVLNFFFSVLSVAVGLFLFCYTMNFVETAKSKLNFGLYCCNWTEMDLKFKKTLLLFMSMNQHTNK